MSNLEGPQEPSEDGQDEWRAILLDVLGLLVIAVGVVLLLTVTWGSV
jgi:hypothetical protein